MAEGQVGSSIVVAAPAGAPPDDTEDLREWAKRHIATLNGNLQDIMRKVSDPSIFSARRYLAHKGRAITTANVALSSGFNSISAVTGNDVRGSCTAVLPTPAPNHVDPYVTLTFIDGAWPSVPFALVAINYVDGSPIVRTFWSTTTTTLAFGIKGTLTFGGTWTFHWVVLG